MEEILKITKEKGILRYISFYAYRYGERGGEDGEERRGKRGEERRVEEREEGGEK